MVTHCHTPFLRNERVSLAFWGQMVNSCAARRPSDNRVFQGVFRIRYFALGPIERLTQIGVTRLPIVGRAK